MVATAVYPGAPAGGKVTVHVQALRRGRDGNGKAVVVDDIALGQQAVALRAARCALGGNTHHEATVVSRRHPATVGVSDPHISDRAVAVDVALVQAGRQVRIAPRPGAHAAAAELRTVGQHPLDAVRVDPRRDIEGAGLEGFGHHRVAAKAGDEVLDQMERGNAAGDFHRVNVGVHPMGRLGVVRAG